MNRIAFVVFCFLMLLGMESCSESKGDSVSALDSPISDSDFEVDSLKGFIHVKSTGKSTVLGTDDLSAKAAERPQMISKFTYDFSLGRHEVLCSDFNELMEAETGLVADCPQDSIPVSNVTFFDVVLYANAYSKFMGVDTSYVYSSAEFDSDKHCVKLNSFSFKADADGFRLPTEAEWVLVARQSWKPKSSWNNTNSENEAHQVCTAKGDDSHFCDLAGNLLEWVNDWLGSLRDTVVTNFVGAVDGGVLGSCIVKGGSFLSDPHLMALYNRGDVYPVLYSSKANYVGFRLAVGKIPDALWLSGNGAAMSSQMVSLVDASELKSLTKSYKVKLAFRNDETRNLVYVNYSSEKPAVIEIRDTLDVYHPEISPDGRRVAFCTGMEGSTSPSAVYVRDLNSSGSNLVRLDVDRAVVPRWKVDENGDTLIVYVTSAKNNKDDSFFEESTWQVPFAKGKFGKPKKLFDGAYHGGVSVDESIAVSGARLLRSRLNSDGKVSEQVWYEGEQACNVSLAKDESKRTLFLDFGGETGKSFAGEKYGVHEQLLIADSTGKLVQMVPSPAKYAFDHSEWAVGDLKDVSSDLVVVSLTNVNGAHRKIALVDLSDSSVVSLVEGGELWHPSLWVLQGGGRVPKPSVDLDSAGVYFENNPANAFSFSSVELAMQLQSFWKKSEEVEVVTFGSSMLLDAVIEDSIKTYVALNMGVTLSDVHLFEYLIKNYVLPYAPKIKALVVEFSPGFLYRSFDEMAGVLRRNSPGILYDENHLSAETRKEIANLSLDQEYPKDLFSQQYIENTFLLPSVSWSVPSVSVDVSLMPYDAPTAQNSLKVFKSLKHIADSCGVTLIAAITPRNPGYKKTEYFDLFGPSKAVAKRLIQSVSDMGIIIFDENKDGDHDYTDEMAYNANHLSYIGAAQFSVRLDSLLKTLR